MRKNLTAIAILGITLALAGCARVEVCCGLYDPCGSYDACGAPCDAGAPDGCNCPCGIYDPCAATGLPAQPVAVAPTPAAVPPPPQQADPLAQLRKKKVRGLSWEEMSLDQVVVYLRTITGFNFYVTPKVREEKFEDIVISLQADDVSVLSVLDVITEPFGLRWKLDKGVIRIMTLEEAGGASKPRTAKKGPLIDPAMKRRLTEVRVNVAVRDTSVGEVIQILQIQTGMNLMIDPRIAADVKDSPVTGMNLEDAELLTAMNMLASAAGEHAVWVSRGKVLVLTRREFADPE